MRDFRQREKAERVARRIAALAALGRAVDELLDQEERAGVRREGDIEVHPDDWPGWTDGIFYQATDMEIEL